MGVRIIHGLEELRSLVGREIGVSDWIEVSQQRILAFAEATEDRQWIHCDPERARAESRFGTTIAHGFLTLSLGPALVEQVFTLEGMKFTLNYGLNRVRFPAAVKSGSRLRLKLDLIELKDFPGGVQAVYKQTFEAEGTDKPVCVAEQVARHYVDG